MIEQDELTQIRKEYENVRKRYFKKLQNNKDEQEKIEETKRAYHHELKAIDMNDSYDEQEKKAHRTHIINYFNKVLKNIKKEYTVVYPSIDPSLFTKQNYLIVARHTDYDLLQHYYNHLISLFGKIYDDIPRHSYVEISSMKRDLPEKIASMIYNWPSRMPKQNSIDRLLSNFSMSKEYFLYNNKDYESYSKNYLEYRRKLDGIVTEYLDMLKCHDKDSSRYQKVSVGVRMNDYRIDSATADIESTRIKNLFLDVIEIMKDIMEELKPYESIVESTFDVDLGEKVYSKNSCSLLSSFLDDDDEEEDEDFLAELDRLINENLQ